MIGFTEARKKIQNKKSYHEALIRNGWAVPALKGQFLTSEVMVAIRENRMYCPRYENMMMRPCP